MSGRFLSLDATLSDYVLAHTGREHPAQAALREATRGHAHAGMQIGPDQAQLMALLVRLLGARHTIEIGVFTGYSALAVALALPDDGRVLACDINAAYVDVGRPHWQAAGVAHKIDVRIGPALATLDTRLAAGEAGRYDFAFIDADKTGYPTYWAELVPRMRPGGVLLVDNVLRGGRVIAEQPDPDTAAIVAFNDIVAADDRVESVMIPLADGLTIARVKP